MKFILPLACCITLLTGCTAQPPAEPEPSPEATTTSSMTEEEFNNSGRAKAIENETDLWMLYADEGGLITLKYPHNVTLGDPLDPDALQLFVDIKPIEGLAETMGYNEDMARKNLLLLSQGEYGDDVDFQLEESKKIRKIGEVNAQEFMTLSRFEVCDITFERKLYFFRNDHQIVITLAGPKSDIVEAESQYFATDMENCGDSPMWIFDKQMHFYRNLKHELGSPIAQEWFNTFDDIIDTLELQGPIAPSDPTPDDAEDNAGSTSWLTHTNTEFGYAIDYPETAEITKEFSGEEASNWVNDAKHALFIEAPEGKMRLIVRSTESQFCDGDMEFNQDDELIDINGTKFRRMMEDLPGMETAGRFINFDGLYNNQCFSFHFEKSYHKYETPDEDKQRMNAAIVELADVMFPTFQLSK